MKTALGIFAKTIGLSEVKTRLAAEIGKELAEDFYRLSIAAISDIAEEAASSYGLHPYWVLAEEKGPQNPFWHGKEVFWTGDGSLGMRLHSVYEHLLQDHDAVLLIGTDSPQLSASRLEDALLKLKRAPNNCVIGPALDGGFYLFGAARPLPKEVWTEVTYSHETTLNALSAKIRGAGIDILSLPPESDIDHKTDLIWLKEKLSSKEVRLPPQEGLSLWLQKNL